MLHAPLLPSRGGSFARHTLRTGGCPH
jgi:hypothetical protein